MVTNAPNSEIEDSKTKCTASKPGVPGIPAMAKPEINKAMLTIGMY
jgi:hypothetical protein